MPKYPPRTVLVKSSGPGDEKLTRAEGNDDSKRNSHPAGRTVRWLNPFGKQSPLNLKISLLNAPEEMPRDVCGCTIGRSHQLAPAQMPISYRVDIHTITPPHSPGCAMVRSNRLLLHVETWGTHGVVPGTRARLCYELDLV